MALLSQKHNIHLYISIFTHTCLQLVQKQMPVASFSQLDFITNESVTGNDETLLNIKNNRN